MYLRMPFPRLMIVLIAASFFFSCDDDNPGDSGGQTDYDIMYGIWINEAYNSDDNRPAKVIISKGESEINFIFVQYAKTTDDTPSDSEQLTPDSIWKDGSGDIFLRSNTEVNAQTFYFLQRFLANKSAYEVCGSFTAYPQSIDLNNDFYVIMYRQQ